MGRRVTAEVFSLEFIRDFYIGTQVSLKCVMLTERQSSSVLKADRLE